MKINPLFKNFVFVVLILLVLGAAFSFLYFPAEVTDQITASQLAFDVNQEKVKQITVSGEKLAIVYQDDKIFHKVFYEPVGVAAVITPWNFPLSNFVWGAGQNLIAGNTVVFKHSEECPLFGKQIEELVDRCGLPNGVFSEVYGDGKIGDILVHQDIDLISFTGSTTVGKYLYKVAAEKFIKTFFPFALISTEPIASLIASFREKSCIFSSLLNFILVISKSALTKNKSFVVLCTALWIKSDCLALSSPVIPTNTGSRHPCIAERCSLISCETRNTYSDFKRSFSFNSSLAS